jgi:hypothetical protein
MENNLQDSLAMPRHWRFYSRVFMGDLMLCEIFYIQYIIVRGRGKQHQNPDQYRCEDRQSPKDSGKPFKGTILSIDIINSIAVVKGHVKMYDFEYDQFLSFHKIDNKWVIVTKMISDVAD